MMSAVLLAGAAVVVAGGEPNTTEYPAPPPPKPTAAATAPKADQSGAAAKESTSGAEGGALYKVEGNKVDADTLAGWKTWRALACERCHGAEQEGLVGPALRESLKTMSKEDFFTTITNGRPEKGMPPFSTSKMVMENKEHLYAYLKGRADGKIPPGRLEPLQ
jgi:mono/diheme cytochrome c family protein